MLSPFQERWFSIAHPALLLSFTLGSVPSLWPVPYLDGAGQSCEFRSCPLMHCSHPNTPPFSAAHIFPSL